MLMFVDETAHSKKTSAKTNGWSLVGKRYVQRQCFGHGQRFSILPILTLDGIITYNIVPRSVNSECFLQFLCKLVVRASIYAFDLETCLIQHRSPFLILTQVLKVSSFWTTAIFITLNKFTYALKMTLICTVHIDIILILLCTDNVYRCR